jgi:acetyl-CoA/propionyl-CoA carboxylase biotin carboxyl carrier protein
MLRALGELEVGGVRTTVPADVALLGHPDFVAGNHSTKWVEEEVDPALLAGSVSEPTPIAPGAGAEAEAVPLEERTIPVEVDGKRFSVRVWLPETPAAGEAGPRGGRVSKPKLSAGGRGAGGGTVSAPMQGTIVKVLVAEGDAVEPGQALLVLEAMKMENHLNAEQGGTVKEVRVAAGDTVGTGDVLIVIE